MAADVMVLGCFYYMEFFRYWPLWGKKYEVFGKNMLTIN
jgi:hypothetical protein